MSLDAEKTSRAPRSLDEMIADCQREATDPAAPVNRRRTALVRLAHLEMLRAWRDGQSERQST